MTAHGFTAGPWVLRDSMQSSVIYKLNARGSNRFWLSVQRGHDDNGERITAKEAHEIARLIKAAPMMLEALVKARQFIRNGVELGYIHMPFDPDPATETLPAIEQAIAAATGSRG